MYIRAWEEVRGISQCLLLLLLPVFPSVEGAAPFLFLHSTFSFLLKKREVSPFRIKASSKVKGQKKLWSFVVNGTSLREFLEEATVVHFG